VHCYSSTTRTISQLHVEQVGRYVNHGANQPAIRMVSPPWEQVFGSDKSGDPCWPCRKRKIQNVLSNRGLVSSITTSFFSAKASIWSWSACEDVLTLIHIYITILNHIKPYLIILYQIKSYETYKLLPCSTSAVCSGYTDATRCTSVSAEQLSKVGRWDLSQAMATWETRSTWKWIQYIYIYILYI